MGNLKLLYKNSNDSALKSLYAFNLLESKSEDIGEPIKNP